jgi:hypothetical protein
MGDMGHLIPPNLENSFHEYDRQLRLNLALRRAHGPLPGDEGRSPTGASLAQLTEENQKLRAALERRGLEVPRVTEGAVQPTTLLAEPRRHIPGTDPKICPLCGLLRKKEQRVCRCGYSWVRGLRRGGARRRLAHEDPRWDFWLAWGLGSVAALAGLLWLLQPFFR